MAGGRRDGRQPQAVRGKGPLHLAFEEEGHRVAGAGIREHQVLKRSQRLGGIGRRGRENSGLHDHLTIPSGLAANESAGTNAPKEGGRRPEKARIFDCRQTETILRLPAKARKVCGIGLFSHGWVRPLAEQRPSSHPSTALRSASCGIRRGDSGGRFVRASRAGLTRPSR